MVERELPPEVVEYLDSLDEHTREIFDRYISIMAEEFDWLPRSANWSGLWFDDSDTFWSNQINIGSDASYAIYDTDRYDGTPAEDRLSEIFASWSAELSDDGQPHPR